MPCLMRCIDVIMWGLGEFIRGIRGSYRIDNISYLGNWKIAWDAFDEYVQNSAQDWDTHSNVYGVPVRNPFGIDLEVSLWFYDSWDWGIYIASLKGSRRRVIIDKHDRGIQ